MDKYMGYKSIRYHFYVYPKKINKSKKRYMIPETGNRKLEIKSIPIYCFHWILNTPINHINKIALNRIWFLAWSWTIFFFFFQIDGR